ncbi:hypothetical protein [Flavobacterium hercynium]|uniref:Uncharacterized protein n=1 Tax=Flavobacterium hercynium TaxID=387094 RepID=A0A226GTT7_9FLAO|nr:hypothetical protein [Flavobacterium hercynium]OXA84861.1 hypothetical protein B0A66_20450 [Flavobacterium hercynium]SMP22013.1 hypothetical protein SAMN06265346_107108 [Flavobacterium hercynium]
MPNLVSPREVDTATLLDNYFYDYLVFNEVLDTKKIDLHDNTLIIHIAVDVNFTYIKLTNLDAELLSVVRLEIVKIFNVDYYKVNKSHSVIQQKGYGTKLYEYCLCYLDLPLISDKIQTKAGSSNLWFNLIKSKKFKIYKLDLKTQKIRKLNPKSSKYSIWGVDESVFENFKNVSKLDFQEQEYEDIEDYNNDNNDLFEFDYPDYTKEKFVHPQLEVFMKNGLRSKKIQKERIKDNIDILLVGDK